MERLGVENVSEDVLLAIVLRGGVRGCNVLDLARILLKEYGSLTALAGASVEDMTRRFKGRGVGRVKAQVLKAALELGRRLNEELLPERVLVRTPEDVARLMRDRCRTLDREIFWVLCLDTKNRMKGKPEEVSQGLLDASLVHPREVFRSAVIASTAAAVLVHNHPSGDPSPSAEDVRITRQLIEAGKIMGIKVLDHVIIGTAGGTGAPDFLSMREGGVVAFD